MARPWLCNGGFLRPLSQVPPVSAQLLEGIEYYTMTDFFALCKYLQHCASDGCLNKMAMDPRKIAEMLKLRALGWSQEEIAEAIGTSRQVIGYQLKKLKEESMKKGSNEVFQAALIGGMAGAVTSIGLIALLSELFKENNEQENRHQLKPQE